MMHIADNQDALLDYLYEEGDPAERLKIAQHLQECARCSVAMLEFQTVRGMLTEWRPPAPRLGFRIVQDEPAPARFGSRLIPQQVGWAQAAAAVLLFAAGMAVSQIRVDYSDGAVTLRTQSAAPVGGGIRSASITLPAEGVVMGSGPSRTATNPPSADAAASTEELLQRVRSMIEQSEVRQQRELALRLSQVSNEVETQHRADLLRVQQNFGQLEMETGAQINQQQQQIMDYLVRTSGGAK